MHGRTVALAGPPPLRHGESAVADLAASHRPLRAPVLPIEGARTYAPSARALWPFLCVSARPQPAAGPGPSGPAAPWLFSPCTLGGQGASAAIAFEPLAVAQFVKLIIYPLVRVRGMIYAGAWRLAQRAEPRTS